MQKAGFLMTRLNYGFVFIFRVTEHLVPDDDGLLPTEEIYQTYQIETALDRKKEINYNSFCKILQYVFRTEQKRKIIYGRKQVVYPAKWSGLDQTKTLLNTEELVQLLMPHGHVTCLNENNITLARSTGFLSNNNIIFKEVTLCMKNLKLRYVEKL